MIRHSRLGHRPPAVEAPLRCRTGPSPSRTCAWTRRRPAAAARACGPSRAGTRRASPARCRCGPCPRRCPCAGSRRRSGRASRASRSSARAAGPSSTRGAPPPPGSARKAADAAGRTRRSARTRRAAAPRTARGRAPSARAARTARRTRRRSPGKTGLPCPRSTGRSSLCQPPPRARPRSGSPRGTGGSPAVSRSPEGSGAACRPCSSAHAPACPPGRILKPAGILKTDQSVLSSLLHAASSFRPSEQTPRSLSVSGTAVSRLR